MGTLFLYTSLFVSTLLLLATVTSQGLSDNQSYVWAARPPGGVSTTEQLFQPTPWPGRLSHNQSSPSLLQPTAWPDNLRKNLTNPRHDDVISMSMSNTTSNQPKPAKTLWIGFLPALSANKGQSKHFVGAFKCALDDMNANVLKGTGYQLDYRVYDNRADTLESLRKMTDLYQNGTAVFIGPEDTCAIEARLAAAWNLPMIAFKCRDSAVSNKEGLYPTFIRTIPSTYKVSKSLIALLNHFGWKHFQAIVGNTSNWREAASTLRQRAEVAKIHMNEDFYYEESFIGAIDTLKDLLEKTYQQTRIYVFLGDHHALIDFVRCMKARNLINGEYLVVSVAEAPYDYKLRYRYFYKFIENLEQDYIDAFKSVLILMPSTPNNPLYDEFLNKSLSFSYQSPFNAPQPPYPDTKMMRTVPIYAAYLYDAVSLYARAVKEVLAEKLDPKNGTAIVLKTIKRNYQSIQGNTMFIDAYGNAEANYTLLAVLEDEEPFGQFSTSLQPVAHFMTHGVKIPAFSLDRPIPWVGGRIPVSEPECGFDGLKPECQFQSNQYWPIALICVVVISLVIVALVFVCRHYRYEQKLASLLWKMDYKDLMMVDSEIDAILPEKPIRVFSALSNLSTECSAECRSRALNQSYVRPALYKGQHVAIKVLRKRHVELTRAVKKELSVMKDLNHDNVNNFIGACIESHLICIVTHYCQRGSLKDIFENDNVHLDEMFIASLVFDLVKGMIYLHDSPIGSHGNLRPSNCLVDSRWVLKISDFGLHNLKGRDETMDEHPEKLLWYAPELLRRRTGPPEGTQKGDVYSFAIILYEMHGRKGPWGRRNRKGPAVCTSLSDVRRGTGDYYQSMFEFGRWSRDWYRNLTDADIVARVRNSPDGIPFRPDTSELPCKEFIVRCMQECWHEDDWLRPDFKSIRTKLKPMQQGRSANIFDNMLAIMEKYSYQLEAQVVDRTQQLAEEKMKTETLLLTMLPKVVAEQLIRNEFVIPEQYEAVTIYISDIVGFTELSAQSTPMQVVDMLNDLYTLFDSVIEEYDVYKVETIGDAYMVVSGLPIRNHDNHAGEIASMSLHLLRSLQGFSIRHLPSATLKLRIGIHSGPVVAGVVGLKMPRYCLFGDTVNTTSRMESTGEALKVHCSAACKELLDKLGGYDIKERGMTSMKGKGEMLTYFVEGEDGSQRLLRIKKEGWLSDGGHFPESTPTSQRIAAQQQTPVSSLLDGFRERAGTPLPATKLPAASIALWRMDRLERPHTPSLQGHICGGIPVGVRHPSLSYSCKGGQEFPSPASPLSCSPVEKVDWPQFVYKKSIDLLPSSHCMVAEEGALLEDENTSKHPDLNIAVKTSLFLDERRSSGDAVKCNSVDCRKFASERRCSGESLMGKTAKDKTLSHLDEQRCPGDSAKHKTGKHKTSRLHINGGFFGDAVKGKTADIRMSAIHAGGDQSPGVKISKGIDSNQLNGEVGRKLSQSNNYSSNQWNRFMDSNSNLLGGDLMGGVDIIESVRYHEEERKMKKKKNTTDIKKDDDRGDSGEEDIHAPPLYTDLVLSCNGARGADGRSSWAGKVPPNCLEQEQEQEEQEEEDDIDKSQLIDPWTKNVDVPKRVQMAAYENLTDDDDDVYDNVSDDGSLSEILCRGGYFAASLSGDDSETDDHLINFTSKNTVLPSHASTNHSAGTSRVIPIQNGGIGHIPVRVETKSEGRTESRSGGREHWCAYAALDGQAPRHVGGC